MHKRNDRAALKLIVDGGDNYILKKNVAFFNAVKCIKYVSKWAFHMNPCRTSLLLNVPFALG